MKSFHSAILLLALLALPGQAVDTGGDVAAMEMASDTTFGHSLRKYWNFPSNLTYFQHGSYGVTPQAVLAAARAYAQAAESDPWEWMRSTAGGRKLLYAY